MKSIFNNLLKTLRFSKPFTKDPLKDPTNYCITNTRNVKMIIHDQFASSDLTIHIFSIFSFNKLEQYL